MSYCRFSDGDVYMYEHVGGFIECCACSLADLVPTVFTKGIPPSRALFYKGPDDPTSKPCKECNGERCRACMMQGNKSFKLRSEALAHLHEHEAAGENVPDYAFEGLARDMEKEGDRIPDMVFDVKTLEWKRKRGRKKKKG